MTLLHFWGPIESSSFAVFERIGTVHHMVLELILPSPVRYEPYHGDIECTIGPSSHVDRTLVQLPLLLSASDKPSTGGDSNMVKSFPKIDLQLSSHTITLRCYRSI